MGLTLVNKEGTEGVELQIWEVAHSCAIFLFYLGGEI